MARSWREVRADAVSHGRLDSLRADAARQIMQTAVRAYRFTELRK